MNKKDNIKQLIQELKKRNPYPDDIFLEKTTENWRLFNNALSAEGILADGFLGCYGRKVWNNCISEIELILEDYDIRIIIKQKR